MDDNDGDFIQMASSEENDSSTKSNQQSSIKQLTVLEQLHAEWQKDAIIDKTEPSKELIRIPVLHAKYISILSKYNLKVKQAEHDFYVLRRAKLDYYSGRLSQEELKARGLQPFKFVLKQDMSDYLEGDGDIIKIKERIAIYNEIVNTCERILKELNQRTYQLSNYTKWEMFIAGV